MTILKENDKILGTIRHNGKVIQIALDFDYSIVYGFVINPKRQVFEIDFRRFGKKLKIYFIKVYDKENDGLGTKALAYFEKWGLNNGVKKIIGELVDDKDSSIPVKLRHFYLKNDYSIENTGDAHQYARISKSLT